ncbi:MAG: hypothetical protein AAB502_11015, partial [Chloroflexota bacterium]
MEEIANKSLTEEVIPPAEADEREIARFSATFDGYRRWGSGTRGCAEIANKWRTRYKQDGSLPESVAVIRTCLFFEQRRAHWLGYDYEGLAYVRCLLDTLRKKVREGAHLQS